MSLNVISRYQQFFLKRTSKTWATEILAKYRVYISPNQRNQTVQKALLQYFLNFVVNFVQVGYYYTKKGRHVTTYKACQRFLEVGNWRNQVQKSSTFGWSLPRKDDTERDKKKQKKREVEIRKTKHAKEIKLYTTAMSQETPVAVIGPTLWKESPQRNRKSN